MCGHNTQVVWKAITNLGCALVAVPTWICDGTFTRGKFFTCNYYPPGNVASHISPGWTHKDYNTELLSYISRYNDIKIITKLVFFISLLEIGGPNNSANVTFYTKTRQMSPPLNVAKALAET
jgi:hypothetical protein